MKLASADGFQVVVMPLMSQKANEQQRADIEATPKPTAEDIIAEVEAEVEGEPTEAEVAEAVAEAEATAKAEAKPRRSRSRKKEPVAVA